MIDDMDWECENTVFSKPFGVVLNSGSDKTENFVQIDVPPDGSCLFWSVAFAYLIPVVGNNCSFQERYKHLFNDEGTEDQKSARELILSNDFRGKLHRKKLQNCKELEDLVRNKFRNNVVDYMLRNRADFEDDIKHDQTKDFNEYLDYMRNLESWGGDIEVKAMSKMLGIGINLFSQGKSYYFGKKDCGTQIRLFYVNTTGEGKGENHYNFGLEQNIIDLLSGRKEVSNEQELHNLKTTSMVDNKKEKASKGDIQESTSLILNKLEGLRDPVFHSERQRVTEKLFKYNKLLICFIEADDCKSAMDILKNIKRVGLLEQTLNISRKTDKSYFLFTAIEHDALDIVRFVIDAKVSPDLLKFGFYKLPHWAAMYNARKSMEYLEEEGLSKLDDLDDNGYNALDNAVKCCSIDVIELLSKKYEIRDSLYAAIEDDELEIFKLLVEKYLLNDEKKINFNVKTNGDFILHSIAQYDAIKILKYLVQCVEQGKGELNIYIRDDEGNFFLHRAIENRSIDVLRYALLDMRLDPNVKNNYDKTLLELFISNPSSVLQPEISSTSLQYPTLLCQLTSQNSFHANLQPPLPPSYPTQQGTSAPQQHSSNYFSQSESQLPRATDETDDRPESSLSDVRLISIRSAKRCERQ